jgi:hypothetical protein
MHALALSLLMFAAPLAANEDGWRATAVDFHEGRIDQAHGRALAALDGVAEDAYGQADLPAARALLTAATKARTYTELLGKWRCSSTQIGPDGVFAYPAFRCLIEDSEDGTIRFSKVSGSQRRSGQLFPFNDHGWVLLGASTVNDDPERAYSATLATAVGEDVEADTVGLLETLADGRMRIILDAEEGRVELYALSR